MTDSDGDQLTPDAPGSAAPMLPFDPADLVAVRVRPADFARMIGVSKQAVSKWVKRGTITLGPDGRLDPSAAAKQLLRNGGRIRYRNRLLREAAESAEELRQRLRATKQELSTLQASHEALRRSSVDAREHCERLCCLLDAIGRHCARLAALSEYERDCRLSQLTERVVWGATAAQLEELGADYELDPPVLPWLLQEWFVPIDSRLSIDRAAPGAGEDDR